MKYLSLTLAILNIILFVLYFTNVSRVAGYQWVITPMFAAFFYIDYLNKRNENKQMIIIMMQTVALIANGDPQFKIATPTRFGETKSGKYLVYENKND